VTDGGSLYNSLADKRISDIIGTQLKPGWQIPSWPQHNSS
jgi:hypothetical protein